MISSTSFTGRPASLAEHREGVLVPALLDEPARGLGHPEHADEQRHGRRDEGDRQQHRPQQRHDHRQRHRMEHAALDAGQPPGAVGAGHLVVLQRAGEPHPRQVGGPEQLGAPVAGVADYAPLDGLAEHPSFVVFNGSTDALTGMNALQAATGERVRMTPVTAPAARSSGTWSVSPPS